MEAGGVTRGLISAWVGPHSVMISNDEIQEVLGRSLGLNAADLDDAIGTARDIVRNIRAGRFDMAEDYPARFEDAFANICQTRVFGGGDDLESEA